MGDERDEEQKEEEENSRGGPDRKEVKTVFESSWNDNDHEYEFEGGSSSRRAGRSQR